ncbi:MAG: FkbM family methyltransferase [Pirellulales bacterium]
MHQLEARRRRARFASICQRCGLKLDYALNSPGLPILEEVFVKRNYADYFPFYQRNNVLDIGGHFGYFSIFAALNSAPGTRVVTVEPAARNLGVLRANIARMGLDQIQPLHGAVAETTGTATMHVTRAHNCSLIAEHSRGLAAGDEVTSETVPTFTLADVLAQHNLDSVDVLKLDCEGAEYGIIYESPKEVLQRSGLIMMEFHDLKDARRSGLAMVEQLKLKGFHVIQFHHLPSNMNLNYGKIVAVRE